MFSEHMEASEYTAEQALERLHLAGFVVYVYSVYMCVGLRAAALIRLLGSQVGHRHQWGTVGAPLRGTVLFRLSL